MLKEITMDVYLIHKIHKILLKIEEIICSLKKIVRYCNLFDKARDDHLKNIVKNFLNLYREIYILFANSQLIKCVEYLPIIEEQLKSFTKELPKLQSSINSLLAENNKQSTVYDNLLICANHALNIKLTIESNNFPLFKILLDFSPSPFLFHNPSSKNSAKVPILSFALDTESRNKDKYTISNYLSRKHPEQVKLARLYLTENQEDSQDSQDSQFSTDSLGTDSLGSDSIDEVVTSLPTPRKGA